MCIHILCRAIYQIEAIANAELCFMLQLKILVEYFLKITSHRYSYGVSTILLIADFYSNNTGCVGVTRINGIHLAISSYKCDTST